MGYKFIAYRDLPTKNIRYSRAQIRRLQNLPPDDPRKFPDPVKGLGKEDQYLEAQVDAYIERQIAAAGKREYEAEQNAAPF
jgi:hypothetical protein